MGIHAKLGGTYMTEAANSPTGLISSKASSLDVPQQILSVIAPGAGILESGAATDGEC
jgi:hypothetical protein